MPEGQREPVLNGLLAYEGAKRASAAFDFDDLLRYAAIALESDPALRRALGRRWRHVLIDEVQDTNHAQYRIVSLLAAEHRNLMILGDPDQSICAYRGATSEENFAAFARDFPENDVVVLDRNYRSTKTILRAANAVIDPNRGRHRKRLWTDGPDGKPVAVEACEDELDEADRIAGWARAHLDQGHRASELCVLVRVNELATAIEQALMAARIPIHIAGTIGFTARAEIRDALAALSLVANPRDRLAFARVARAGGAGVGDNACRALFDHQDAHPQRSLLEHGTGSQLQALRPRQARAIRNLCGGLLAVDEAVDRRPSDVARHVTAALLASRQPVRLLRILQTSASDRARRRARRSLERLRELVRLARAYESNLARPDLGDFVASLTLTFEFSGGRTPQDAMSVMTIHRAKGLEFDHVWIAGLEEGLLPRARSVRESLEPEERRLACALVASVWAASLRTPATGVRGGWPALRLADLGSGTRG
jgi:DNA helicase-2/ATP-dependent DNA helicase PcrA